MRITDIANKEIAIDVLITLMHVVLLLIVTAEDTDFIQMKTQKSLQCGMVDSSTKCNQ